MFFPPLPPRYLQHHIIILKNSQNRPLEIILIMDDLSRDPELAPRLVALLSETLKDTRKALEDARKVSVVQCGLHI